MGYGKMITAQEARNQLNELFHLDEIKEMKEFKNIMNMLDANIRATILKGNRILWVSYGELECAAKTNYNPFVYTSHLIGELESLGFTAGVSYSEAEQKWGIRIAW
jgi:hypothetical protein